MHWLMRRIRFLIDEHEVTCSAVERRAGIALQSIERWNRTKPRLENVEAALEALGYELCIRRAADHADALEKLRAHVKKPGRPPGLSRRYK